MAQSKQNVWSSYGDTNYVEYVLACESGDEMQLIQQLKGGKYKPNPVLASSILKIKSKSEKIA